MKNTLLVLAVSLTALQSCSDAVAQKESLQGAVLADKMLSVGLINPEGATLETRILPPVEYERSPAATASFAHYLRQLPLKPHGAPVLYYNGQAKDKAGVHVAVVDLPIGKKDLHQCADAVMRLRADYLWNQQQYQKIHFNLTNGFRVDYSEWMKGKRVAVEGNRTWWKQSAAPGNTPEGFWRYLEFVFTYAGTLSLARELKPVPVEQLEAGDVFIQGGSPGHAVIVVDKAIHPRSGKVLFLLAQSYMPAQEIHILQNPLNKAISPWYEANPGEILYTPEWSFKDGDLKRFGDN